MIRSLFSALGLLGLSSTLAVASPISLGNMANFAVFSPDGAIYNNHYSSPTTTAINDGLKVGSRFSFVGPDSIQYNGGGSYQQIAYAGAEHNGFFALTTALSGLSGTPIVSWSGLTPGSYTFTGATLPSTVSLTAPGSYVFKYVGTSRLDLVNTNISLGAGLSSDDVIWYIPADFGLSNGTFSGVAVVQGYGATVEANGAPLNVQGRILAEGNVALYAWNNGGDLTFTTKAAAVPELPSTFFFLVLPILAACAISPRRFSPHELSPKG